MGRLFGTDGIRGVANKELTCELALKLGRALAAILKNGGTPNPKIIVGGDTRISTDMLMSAVSAGICSMGGDAVCIGVCATPAVAYLVKNNDFDAGVMISASHNPSEYNGLKVFSSDGFKLPDELEEKIESMILEPEKNMPETDGAVGKVIYSDSLVDEYAKHLVSIPKMTFEGFKIALDCANGSSSATAEKIFRSLGAEVYMLSDKPDGVNINESCGSTHTENLSEFVVKNSLDAGFAFDGDADRCMCIDEKGELIDGDMMMAVCSLGLRSRGKLNKDTVVGTVMTNFGFTLFCRENGLNFIPTKVGDRYVLEEMLAGDYALGGEQSGHIIFKEYATTGDGQLTALMMMCELIQSGKKMSELASVMKHSPQVLINLKVTPEGKIRCHTDPEIKNAISRAHEKLSAIGRVLVRPSGTEPLVRIMAEGSDEALINETANELCEFIKRSLAEV